MQASELAGIGKVALMQEPVAAVMSVMRVRDKDGTFLIYDLGGGTLDIAIAESIGGRVNLLSHGGIQMCGGRDFDRILIDNLVRPWLLEQFNLPEDLSVSPLFKRLLRLATWATERAKIELSAREEVIISLSEMETGIRDLDDEEIYLDIPLERTVFDRLIADRVESTIGAARETLTKAGLTPHDVECIVWVGGPTNYKPLRDKVAFELGIAGDMAVNPMIAVAEGASLFAESIEWTSASRKRRETRGRVSSGGELALTFAYIARTPSVESKIAVQVGGEVLPGCEFQVDSLDTGWTSGRLPLQHGATVEITLAKPGDNTFKVSVYDAAGGRIAIEQEEIVITRTAATVDAIPASHSIALEVLDRRGGNPVLRYLVREGESLPKKGHFLLKAGEALEAGAAASLNFKLWEGEIADPIKDNRPIGFLKVSGSDFAEGDISIGSEIECHYEVLDSGELKLEVSIPEIGGIFDSMGKNFYSRQEGQIDYSSEAARVADEGREMHARIDHINDVVDDPKLAEAREKLDAATLLHPDESDPEKVQEASEGILAAKKLLFHVRKEHQKPIRQIELDDLVTFFDKYVRQHARASEEESFDKLMATAQRSIDTNGEDFEHHLGELRGRNFEILWRQDWFVIAQFRQIESTAHLFADRPRFEALVNRGIQLLRSEDLQPLLDLSPEEQMKSASIRSETIGELRTIVAQMMSIPRIDSGSDSDEMQTLVTNILAG